MDGRRARGAMDTEVSIPRDLLLRTIATLREHWFITDSDGEEDNDEDCIALTEELEKYK